MYYFAGYAIKLFLSIFGWIKVFQKENLPEKEGYVLACTHTGWVDILWLGCSILPEKVHYMAKKELFESRGLKWLMNSLNAFPVDRENPGPSSIKMPVKLIKNKSIVGIFPSGTRTSEDVPLKRGAVTIAGHAKSPIVPAAYTGPNNFKELLRWKRPKIIFGEPIYLRKDIPKKEAFDVMAEELNEAMKALQEKIK
ncbi:MAG TPA: lysophospholipid acyltransferase family protein [Pseudogracilibacillus sp.]|nr:lysophospholipid acyltransferase family protein [Pseudogracilibacillus sp.]